MDTIGAFLYHFFGQFFEGIWGIFTGIFKGIVKCFNFKEYAATVKEYTSSGMSSPYSP